MIFTCKIEIVMIPKNRILDLTDFLIGEKPESITSCKTFGFN